MLSSGCLQAGLCLFSSLTGYAPVSGAFLCGGCLSFSVFGVSTTQCSLDSWETLAIISSSISCEILIIHLVEHLIPSLILKML